ncbi:MAG: glycoside hydrolase family 9 protein [Butyrivibrio sp.]|nr:glycoside hydrolase family 9 protein [Muribaculum sp.]MCM1551722.1 glycoside hydrolase family 9 protein [Butyrivibrio sp.]
MLPVICLAAFLCGGCSVPMAGDQGAGGEVVGAMSMESTPVIDYTVPRLFPNVLVDRNGYRVEGSKRAVVKGHKLPESFQLVDARTKAVIYSAELELVDYDQEQDLYSAYADFNEWTQAGSYYLECEYVGRSYAFSLEEDLYERFLSEVCQEMIAECRSGQISIADVNRMLLAYEWYGEVFSDENGDRIPDILEAVADWIDVAGEQEAGLGQEASYAALLAKFSFLYQNYDRQYATECLRRASVVFEQSQGGMQKDAECFYALTELYRATGLDTYMNQIAEYRMYFEGHSNYTEEDGYLYGIMTYMNTRQNVDVELCDIFMDAVMGQGEAIGGLYQEILHPLTARNNGTQDLLRHASELACANYVMNNYQYNYVMEEFLHYLGGRNLQSLDFYELEPEYRSQYLLLLTQLSAVQGSTDNQ